jgi:DNA-binding IclR family transcriptional regulator
MDDSSPRTLKTVERTFDVIAALQDLKGAGVTEVADYLDVSKSAAYNHLATLKKLRFVVKEDDVYHLSLRFLLLGESVRNENDLFRHARDEIDELAKATGEYAHLSTVQHGLSVNLYKAKGDRAIGTAYQSRKLEKPDFLHFSATGKAMLAFMPRNEVEEIIDRCGLERKTENTITDPEELFAALETIRDRGYSLNEEEEVKGIHAIGAPILDDDGEVLGSISVSGPANRFEDEEYHDRIVNQVTETANVIQVSISTNEVVDLPDFA